MATVSCIDAESTKSLIYPGKFQLRWDGEGTANKEKYRKNIFRGGPYGGATLLRSNRNEVKKTENVTVKVTKSVADYEAQFWSSLNNLKPIASGVGKEHK